jgi:hypothetical protein
MHVQLNQLRLTYWFSIINLDYPSERENKVVTTKLSGIILFLLSKQAKHLWLVGFFYYCFAYLAFLKLKTICLYKKTLLSLHMI